MDNVTMITCSPQELAAVVTEQVVRILNILPVTDELYTREEASAFLKMKPRTFAGLKLPYSMPDGKHKVWTKSTLLQHIANTQVLTEQQAKFKAESIGR